MCKLLFLLLWAWLPFVAQAQAPVYISLTSHNEETDFPQYNANPLVYMNTYALVKQLADSVNARGLSWNFQSDWRFLMGALQFDPDSSITNGTNLVRWMDESPYIECDPHAHESTYNYADVAYLHDSLGLSPRYNVGGYKYDGRNGGAIGTIWMDFEAGVSGNQYPWYTWQPNVLWGGSSIQGVSHQYDLRFYGEFHPNDTANFQLSNPSRRIRAIGNGCIEPLFDTTNVLALVDSYKVFLNNVETGVLPANGFYTATLMFNIRDIDQPGFIAKILQVVDSLQPYVDSGRLIWATISEKDSIWRSTAFNEVPLYIDCEGNEIVLGDSDPVMIASESGFEVLPNPAHGNVRIRLRGNRPAEAKAACYDAQGRRIWASPAANREFELNTTNWPSGVYLVRVELPNGHTLSQRLWVP